MSLVPRIWSLLAPGGILFLDQTPHRYYPHESHTTGLPLINYLPERVAFPIARRLSKRVARDASREALYRAGIRGATQGEIVRNIARAGEGAPVVLQPRYLGARSLVDVWFLPSMERRPIAVKRVMRETFRLVSAVSRSSFVPSLTLALQKPAARQGVVPKLS